MNQTANTHKIGVRISETKVAKGDAVLVCYGLGSCVAVAIYDEEQEVGGMAHVLLPGSPRPGDNPSKYSDTSIENLVEKIQKMGGARENMKAKVVGGANMFSWVSHETKKTIGERNARAVLKKLKEMNIRVVAEHTGGTQGRTVEFFAGKGALILRNARGEENSL